MSQHSGASRAIAGLIGASALTMLLALASQPATHSSAQTVLQATPVAAASPISAVMVAARVLVPAPAEADVLYAAGGLARSADGGTTWESAGPPPPPGRIIVAADDPLLLLNGARPPCAKGDPNPPLLQRSDDGGASWLPIASAPGVEPLALWADTQVAVGASCAGLRVSTDAGQTWPDRPPALMDPGYDISAFSLIASADPSARTALVLSTSEGGTSTLRRLDLTSPAQPMASDTLITFWGGASLAGRAEENGETFVVGTANGVLISTDGGASWTSSRIGLEAVTLSVDPNKERIPDAELNRGFGIPAVAFDSTREGRFFAGTVDGLYASADGGVSWQRVPGVDGIVTQIVAASNSGNLVLQTDRKVLTLALADTETE